MPHRRWLASNGSVLPQCSRGRVGMRPELAHCHHGLGDLLAITGRPDEARAELGTALALFGAMGMTRDAELVGASLVALGGAPPSPKSITAGS